MDREFLSNDDEIQEEVAKVDEFKNEEYVKHHRYDYIYIIICL